MILPSLTDWLKTGGLIPAGSHLQQPVDAIRKLAAMSGLVSGDAQVQFINMGWYVITPKGPPTDADKDGQKDFDGCQYWLKLQCIDAAETDDAITLIDDTSESGQPGPPSQNGSDTSTDSQPTIISGTNLSEYVFGDEDDAIGSHYLDTNDTVVVQVFGWWDVGEPDNSHIHYLFICPVGEFWAKITDHTGQDPMNPDDSPFVYDWSKQKDIFNDMTGFVEFADTDPAVTGTYAEGTAAYNSWENSASTSMTAVPSGQPVLLKLTFDNQKPPKPVLRFMFPTVDECSNPDPS